MKKISFLSIFISFFSLSFSFHVEEYKLFDEAQTLTKNQHYEEASFKFRTLEKTLPNSFLVKDNYYNFYNSLNFYKMNNLDKAIFEMEKAVYIPNYLKGKNFFSKERDFYLANFHFQSGNKQSAEFYFLRILENGFSPLEKNSEKIVLENLKENDIKYKVLFEIIFENSFKSGYLLDESNLVEVAQYLLKSNRTLQAEKLLISGYNKTKKSLMLNRLLLKTLFDNKNYSKVLEISSEILEIEPRISYFYYRGKAFKKLKNYPLAIFNLDKVQLQNSFKEKNIFEEEASTNLLTIFFALEDYQKILEIVNKNNSYSNLNADDQFLVILSYFKTSDLNNAFYLSNDFIKNNSSNYEANYLKTLIKNSSGFNKKKLEETINNFINIPALAVSNILIHDFLKKLPTKEKLPVQADILKKIDAIENFKNPDFLVLELENGNFSNSFISDTYAKNNLFHLAFLNSKKNKRDFGNTSNFISYLYPKYYSDSVEKISKKYNLP
ncbi:MAG: tetratricopeptide repeat protein, partial [Fusobacteriaceae bacterium]